MLMPERNVTVPSITEDVPGVEAVSFDLHRVHGARMNRTAVDRKKVRLLDICSNSLDVLERLPTQPASRIDDLCLIVATRAGPIAPCQGARMLIRCRIETATRDCRIRVSRSHDLPPRSRAHPNASRCNGGLQRPAQKRFRARRATHRLRLRKIF